MLAKMLCKHAGSCCMAMQVMSGLADNCCMALDVSAHPKDSGKR